MRALLSACLRLACREVGCACMYVRSLVVHMVVRNFFDRGKGELRFQGMGASASDMTTNFECFPFYPLASPFSPPCLFFASVTSSTFPLPPLPSPNLPFLSLLSSPRLSSLPLALGWWSTTAECWHTLPRHQHCRHFG